MKKLIIFAIIFSMFVGLTGCDFSDYQKAKKLFNDEDYMAALEIYESLGDYKDSKDMVLECKYQIANIVDYKQAIELYESLGDYKESKYKLIALKYDTACSYQRMKKYDDAIALLESISDYPNAVDKLNECLSSKAQELCEDDKYLEAAQIYKRLNETYYYSRIVEPMEVLKTYIKEHRDYYILPGYVNLDFYCQHTNAINSTYFVGFKNDQFGMSSYTFSVRNVSDFEMESLFVWNPEFNGFDYTIESYCTLGYKEGMLRATGRVFPSSSNGYTGGGIYVESYTFSNGSVSDYKVTSFIESEYKRCMSYTQETFEKSNHVISWEFFVSNNLMKK